MESRPATVEHRVNARIVETGEVPPQAPERQPPRRAPHTPLRRRPGLY